MCTKNWKTVFTGSWKSETRLSEIWNKEKKRPSSWLLVVLFLSTAVAAYSGQESGDPWIPVLLQKGWGAQSEICPDLLPGQFGEADGAEVYRSTSGVTFVSRRTENPEGTHCRSIGEPTFVEEI